ncbi:MAG: cell division protein ZapA [Desulfomonilaceae bacterium]|nr:cell division protein ZapA [Desulfomonilaceae bacterium]
MFGREYGVRGHGNKQYIEELADFIRNRAEVVQRNATVVSTLDLVILTLLNITDEMFQDKQVREQTIRELEEKADRLRESVNRED